MTTDKSKLTEDDFEIESRINDEDFNETYQKYCIHIIDNDNMIGEQLKQQILENQEKAEKYDNLDIPKINLLIKEHTDFQQQIKELQEEKQKWIESSEGFRKEFVEEHKAVLQLYQEKQLIKEKLEKIKNIDITKLIVQNNYPNDTTVNDKETLWNYLRELKLIMEKEG